METRRGRPQIPICSLTHSWLSRGYCRSTHCKKEVGHKSLVSDRHLAKLPRGKASCAIAIAQFPRNLFESNVPEKHPFRLLPLHSHSSLRHQVHRAARDLLGFSKIKHVLFSGTENWLQKRTRGASSGAGPMVSQQNARRPTFLPRRAKIS